MAFFQNITIRQIAEKSNVSVATVSRALNGTAPVKKATMERIQQSINELSNTPQEVSLIPKTKTILASFPNLSNPFNTDIIRGISGAAARGNYDVVFYSNNNYSSNFSYRFLETSKFFCGLIVVHNLPDHQILSKLSSKTPVVMCSEHIANNTIPYVAIDDYESACTAVNYLISIGRKKIALVNSSLSNNYAVHRERGFRACLEKANLPINEQWIFHLPDINFDLATGALSHIFESEDRPDACFCVSDVFAAAALKVALEKGISIPSDMSVIGFDDIDLATMTTPTITTIHQPTYQLGWQACNLLIEQIENPGSAQKPIILNTDLIVRGST